MFKASGHPAKTFAMPTSSTLPYAAKQLNDTLINPAIHSTAECSSPQPEPKPSNRFTATASSMPPTVTPDRLTTRIKTPSPPTITAPQQLQHANTCKSTRTNYCTRLPSSQKVPVQGSKTLKMPTHVSPQTQERGSPHSPFCNADPTL